MPNQYVRPAIPYAAQPNPNNNRYSTIAGLNQSPSAEVLEGETNYIIDSMNDLYVFAAGRASGNLPGYDNPANVGKFPITDGAGNITWSNVIAGYLAAQCVGTPALVPGCVTNPILGAACVSYANIQAGAIQNGGIDDDSISFNKILDENNVHFQQFFNNQGAGTLSGASITSGTLPGIALAAGTLPAAALVVNSITNAQLAVIVQIPVGIMMDWAPGGAAPAGWLLASGQSLLRASYPLLFAAIGVTYGSVDGTHFNLPDTRGVAIFGIDPTSGSPTNGKIVNNTPALGGVGGEETHTLTTPEIPAHTHSYTVPNQGNPINTGPGGANLNGAAGNTGSTGGGGAHNNMPPYLLMPKIIYAGV